MHKLTYIQDMYFSHICHFRLMTQPKPLKSQIFDPVPTQPAVNPTHGQLGPQVPPTSPVVHRDQQHYVCCENSLLYRLLFGFHKWQSVTGWINVLRRLDFYVCVNWPKPNTI